MRLASGTRMGRWVEIVCVGVIGLLACVTLSAQSNAGRILGSVTDESGGAIVGASVTVTNVQTGVARNLVTDEAAEYAAPSLIPGTYAVRVAISGFKTFERQNILIETGRDVRVDVKLTPGEVTQTVEVREAIPLIDTTSVTLGGTLSNATINDLPLNGRNYQNLLVLRPGVQIYPGGGSLTQSTNGLRPETMNYLVNGLDNNEGFSGQSVVNSTLPAGDAATILPIDAIQEFNVEVNPPAEFGRKSGAVVNVGLKSGTNNIHGTAYAFGRDGSWDARNYFNPPPQAVAPVTLEQFGATVGGPIKKEKLFYFAAFEEQRYTVGNPLSASIPTTSAGAGARISIADAEVALAARPSPVPLSALSLKLLPLFGANSTSSNLVTTSFPNTATINNVLGKIDYNISSHNILSGSYFFGNGSSVSEDTQVTQPEFRSLGRLRAQFVTSNWTWTPNSRWVNEALFGFTYYYRPVNTFDHTVPASNYGINTGVNDPILFGLPVISVSGFTQMGGSVQWPNIRGPNWNYDFTDRISYLRGKHAFKFGGELLNARVSGGSYSSGRGRFNFNGNTAFAGSTALEDFLAGTPTNATLLVGSPGRHLTQWTYAGFVQDDWHVTSRMSVNLGLRYEYTTPMSEANNLLGNWEPAIGLEQVGKQIKTPYNGYRKSFGPRAGVSWDVTGKGTTVIRAGGGLFWDDLPMSVFLNQVATNNGRTPGINLIPTGAITVLPSGAVQQPIGNISSASFTLPAAVLNWTATGPVLPGGITSTTSLTCGSGGSTGSPCNILAVDRNLRNPFVGTWTLTVQHAFSSSVSFETAYVGNHGGNLTSIADLNSLNPQSAAEIACNHCEAIANRPFGAQYPYLQFINYLTSGYQSNYDGLQATLTARGFHRMSAVLGYTYSHGLDDASHNFNEALPQNSRNAVAEYASSDFDVRHHFSISYTYNLPEKKTWGQLLQGWQFNSVVLLQSGLPWSAIDTGDDVSKTGEKTDRWDFFGNPSDFRSGPAPIPHYNFGALNMPALCISQAATIGATPSLVRFGCYAQGGSVMVAPPIGTFGTMGRNLFRDSGFRNWDLSLFKNWKFKERLTAQFRAEFFNILNHPNFANPSHNSTNDPSAVGQFGCGCATPDVASTNPLLGSGGNRAMQLGLKLLF